MSSHPRFNALPEAIAMFVAGACRRWAIVDGHLVDLQQAARPVAVSRPEYQEPWSTMNIHGEPVTAIAIDDGVQIVTDAPAPPPSVREVCRACGRPMIGEVDHGSCAPLIAFAHAVRSHTKHGREGKGLPGDCEVWCLKCRAEAIIAGEVGP